MTKVKALRPRDCEKILNYNGFYAVNQTGSYVVFIDDLGRNITLRRMNASPIVWKRLCNEYNLVMPSKAFK